MNSEENAMSGGSVVFLILNYEENSCANLSTSSLAFFSDDFIISFHLSNAFAV